MKYVNPKQAAIHFGITEQTLRRWALSGKIDFITSQGGHRRYKINSSQGKQIIYARVSSNKQKHDLQRQIQFLKHKYPSYQIITDIGSGINFKRKGFLSILDELFKGDLKEVVVTHKDRLARFSFDLLDTIFTKFGATINVVYDNQEKQPTEELAEDLLSIITVFTARYHGARKYKILQENQILS